MHWTTANIRALLAALGVRPRRLGVLQGVREHRRSRAGLSERFGTGDVGHGVRQRLLRVAAVVVNLEQDGDVHEDLQQPAGPELHGGLGQQEVDGFKGVAAGPHQHHLDAGGDETNNQG